MPRKSHPRGTEEHLRQLREFLSNFEKELNSVDLRRKVTALLPVFRELRDLGSSLIPRDLADSARERILYYFLKYPRQVISGEEINVVAGINEWPRRVRELKVERGWSLVSGKIIKEMVEEGDLPSSLDGQDMLKMKVDDYVLLTTEQDKEKAYRWKLANSIRRKNVSVQNKILEYLRENVGKQVDGEELRYVANNKKEWARRVRELRTDGGWPIVTKMTGRPDLPVGIYLLEADRQTPSHDRKIPDDVRLAVLERDKYQCTKCGWDRSKWSREVPRILELHHIKPHAEWGDNTAENLRTLCNMCHDKIHRK
jgi:hypothetical protein